jgi:hypothetical protein
MSGVTGLLGLRRSAAACSLGLVLLAACGGDDGDEQLPGTGLQPTQDAAAPITTPPINNASDAAPQQPVGQMDSGVPPVQPSGNDAGTAPTQPAGDWCKVKAVFDKYCTTCHDGQGSFGSPMGLTTLADLTKESAAFPGKKIYERVGARMHDTMRPMPPQGEVAKADMALVDAWIAAKAPGSASETCAPTAMPDGGVPVIPWPEDCEEKYKFLANDGNGGKFAVRPGGQFYQDFMYTAPWKGDVQGVAFKPVVDNKKVLHHYILYQGSGAFLVGWSPGKQEEPLPKDVGVFLPASGSLRMTVHYYNALTGAKTEADASGVEVCVTKKKRTHTAAVMPFAANPSVPANSPRVENSSTCTVSGASQPVHIITSSPHMHGLGIHAKLVVQRANGTTEIVHDKAFNFEEQTTYPIDFVVNNGDKITTTCVYKNTTSRAVSFGTKTEEEMCFNFALYYPMCGMTCTQGDILAAAWSISQGGGCPR